VVDSENEEVRKPGGPAIVEIGGEANAQPSPRRGAESPKFKRPK
jgi:hypothetical protein